MKHHLHFTELSQEQLDWLSRFADRLRLELEHFAEERQGEDAADIAASLWERPEWRAMAPEAAAERWLAERSPKT
jgi:hypothetical protein